MRYRISAPGSLALSLVLVLMISSCGDQEESTTGPRGPAVPNGGVEEQVDQAAKQRNAVDLGAPSGDARESAAARSFTTAAASATQIPFAPKPGPFANSVPTCDDCVYEGVPVGFNFTFFNTVYTTVNISTNGFIMFPPNSSEGCCQGRFIPLQDGLNNLIAAAWTDLFPPGGGGIFYETRGQSPNRYLVVAFQELPWYPESGLNRVTTQIVLYEGSNAIEIHTTNLSGGHIYTQGVEDANGALAAFVPGRVAANYALTNDAVRFSTFGNFWNARASMPAGRQLAAASAVGGSLLVIGGLNNAGTAQRSVFAYNPNANTWSSRAPLPSARYGGSGAAAISGRIYVAGGYNSAGSPTRTLYAYNPGTNAWTTRAPMPVASGCGGSAVISGKLYVFSGCTLLSTGVLVNAGLLHRYDPATNTWTRLRAAPEVHFRPAVAAVGGRLYVAGGIGGSGVVSRRLDMYDPATNTWTTLAQMPTARVAPVGAALGGFFHVIGGRAGTTYLRTVEAYNPTTDVWGPRAPMPTGRAGFGGGLISSDGRFYAVGGRNSTQVLATNQRYTP